MSFDQWDMTIPFTSPYKLQAHSPFGQTLLYCSQGDLPHGSHCNVSRNNRKHCLKDKNTAETTRLLYIGD